MSEKTRILLLSANPRPTGRIQVDEEAREVSEKIHEGPYREQFDIKVCTATRPGDLQRLLLTYQPHIVHFSGHGNKAQRIILEGTPGRARTIDNRGLAQVFALYNRHVRLVVLNACFTHSLARLITESIDFAVGTSKGIGDKAGVAFAGAFYRALGFGKSVKDAFALARAELGLTRMPRAQGIELFIRNGLDESDLFPRVTTAEWALKRTGVRSLYRFTMFETLSITRSRKGIGYLIKSTSARRCDVFERTITPGLSTVTGDCEHLSHCTEGDTKVPLMQHMKQTIGHDSNEQRRTPATSSRKPAGKAAGTRLGILQDWRQASTSEKAVDRFVNRFRDGR